jgi:hypothetical protein
LKNGTPYVLALHLPRGVWWLGAALVIMGLVTPNPALTCASIAVFFTLLGLLWRPGEPPVLLFVMVYQWLQASILVFSADLQWLPLRDIDLSNITLQRQVGNLNVGPATWLSLVGVLGVAAGARMVIGRPSRIAIPGLMESIAHISLRRAFAACLATMAAASLLSEVAYLTGGFAQVLLALANIHWVFVFVYTYAVLCQRRGVTLLLFLLAVELAIGFLGFFSEFKTVLIVMLLAAVAAPSAPRDIKAWFAGVAITLMLLLGIVWSSIKLEYREFISQGTGEQVILVSRSDQIDELARLVLDMDARQFEIGVEKLVDRLSYVYFLSAVMDMVPEFRPYEYGGLWGDAMYRALVPRLLDPDKPIVDDSERTMEYTGLYIIGGEKGTSVSVGYIAESYIDFGPVFMLVPLFLWGCLIGLVYRSFMRNARTLLFGFACATTLVVIGAGTIEASNAKLVASLAVNWLPLWAVFAVAGPYVMRHLSVPSSAGRLPMAGHARP